jgi:hypothetical protein
LKVKQSHKPLYEPPLITLQVTHNEVIAMNVAAGFFRCYAGEAHRQHNLISQLLEQYQHRLQEHILPQQTGGIKW